MRAVGKQNAWFQFRGIKNTEMNVQMLSMPTRPHPARKGELIDVPARDGKLFIDEYTYDRILVSLQCVAVDNDNIDEISAWLSGDGDLVFGDEPERAYRARITKEFARSNRTPRLRGQEFMLTFDCEPFRYESNPVSPITISSTATPITNPGTIESLPLIRVNGSGSGTLMIGRSTMLFDNLDEDNPLYIDCDAKVAYMGNGTTSAPIVLATQNVTGEWIRIDPGKQGVTFGGGITSVVITPRWRWL